MKNGKKRITLFANNNPSLGPSFPVARGAAFYRKEIIVKVLFKDVGRRKASWEADLPVLDESALLRSISKNGGLASRDVDVTLNADGSGVIIVGGFRVVGSFYLVGEPAMPPRRRPTRPTSTGLPREDETNA